MKNFQAIDFKSGNGTLKQWKLPGIGSAEGNSLQNLICDSLALGWLGGDLDAATGTAGEGRAGPVSLSARSDHRPEASAGGAGAYGGLGVPGRAFRAVYTDDPGRPPLPTRLMAGLAILKHTYDLSDEVLCERWVENPYYQFFCGEEFFRHRLVFDRSSLTRWRNRMGEERLQALLRRAFGCHQDRGDQAPSELSRVIVDTTVQPKNVTFPTDAKLLNRAREKLVRLAQLSPGWFAAVLCAPGQVRPDPASALCPCQTVRTHQPDAEEAAHLSRPRHPRHRPQTSTVTAGSKRPFAELLALARRVREQKQSTARTEGLFPCMRRKSNASAKARPIGLTSSASSSALPPPSSTARAASSSPM